MFLDQLTWNEGDTKAKKVGTERAQAEARDALGRQDWAVGQVCLYLHRPFFGGAVFSLFEPLPPTQKMKHTPTPKKRKSAATSWFILPVLEFLF